MLTSFDAVVLLVSFAAGAVAAVTGFGIGSLLTPLVALKVDMALAVAAVSVPHVVGTAIRFALLDARVDRRVFWSFGLTSAAGGLLGAWLHNRAPASGLTLVLGVLLLFAAVSETTGLMRRIRFRGPIAWIAGALSGFFGGLVGNQGGIRSAALLGFDLPKGRFIATATAVALVVDGVRMPAYLASEYHALLAMWIPIAVATGGVAFGTMIGSRVLRRIPELWFRRILALVLAVLGCAMLLKGF